MCYSAVTQMMCQQIPLLSDCLGLGLEQEELPVVGELLTVFWAAPMYTQHQLAAALYATWGLLLREVLMSTVLLLKFADSSSNS